MNSNNLAFVEGIEKKYCQDLFKKIDDIAFINQDKVLEAFRKIGVSPRHFFSSTGYGYDDTARDTLNKLFAEVFRTEDAIVSPLIASGTHALTIALFGLLKPKDIMLCVSGKPYDTLEEVIFGENNGSLKDYLIEYQQIDLKSDRLDYDAIDLKLKQIQPKIVYLQRSRGYEWRDAFSLNDLKTLVKTVRKNNKTALIVLDNCYGEFVDTIEPTEIGVDVMIGSLIKNVGGGLAPTGGYVVGTQKAIEAISYRLTSPSIGKEVGSYNGSYIPFYQGLFLAPTVVRNAIKGNILAGFVFSKLGYEVSPSLDYLPKDIIRSIKFKTSEELIAFCQAIQYASPVDSNVTPYPWDMPGYTHQVIMAAGTFIQGASIELSADSPIKEPFIAYMQGGLTYEHVKIAIVNCLEFLRAR